MTRCAALQEVGAPWKPDTDDESDRHSHAFIVAPDAPVNPVLYWIGHREGDTFALDQAKGPFRWALIRTHTRLQPCAHAPCDGMQGWGRPGGCGQILAADTSAAAASLLGCALIILCTCGRCRLVHA